MPVERAFPHKISSTKLASAWAGRLDKVEQRDCLQPNLTLTSDSSRHWDIKRRSPWPDRLMPPGVVGQGPEVQLGGPHTSAIEVHRTREAKTLYARTAMGIKSSGHPILPA